jgi:hypothetical protein
MATCSGCVDARLERRGLVAPPARAQRTQAGGISTLTWSRRSIWAAPPSSTTHPSGVASDFVTLATCVETDGAIPWPTRPARRAARVSTPIRAENVPRRPGRGRSARPRRERPHGAPLPMIRWCWPGPRGRDSLSRPYRRSGARAPRPPADRWLVRAGRDVRGTFATGTVALSPNNNSLSWVGWRGASPARVQVMCVKGRSDLTFTTGRSGKRWGFELAVVDTRPALNRAAQVTNAEHQH